MFTTLEFQTTLSDMLLADDEIWDAVEDCLMMQDDYPPRPGQTCADWVSRVMGG